MVIEEAFGGCVDVYSSSQPRPLCLYCLYIGVHSSAYGTERSQHVQAMYHRNFSRSDEQLSLCCRGPQRHRGCRVVAKDMRRVTFPFAAVIVSTSAPCGIVDVTGHILAWHTLMQHRNFRKELFVSMYRWEERHSNHTNFGIKRVRARRARRAPRSHHLFELYLFTHIWPTDDILRVQWSSSETRRDCRINRRILGTLILRGRRGSAASRMDGKQVANKGCRHKTLENKSDTIPFLPPNARSSRRLKSPCYHPRHS